MLVIVVVLDEGHDLPDSGGGNPGSPDPVVDQTVRHFDGVLARPRLRVALPSAISFARSAAPSDYRNATGNGGGAGTLS
jgi:hypothetical protein